MREFPARNNSGADTVRSVATVAQLMGISEQAVSYHELRAFRKIRDALLQDPEVREYLRERWRPEDYGNIVRDSLLRETTCAH